MARVSLKPGKHNFCIIACDGVWDVVKPQEAIDFVAEKLKDSSLTAEAIAKQLVDHAYDQGSMDNISATIVVFDWGVAPAAEHSGGSTTEGQQQLQQQQQLQHPAEAMATDSVADGHAETPVQEEKQGNSDAVEEGN